MTAPRDQVLAKVREWLTFAAEDLRLAEHALTIAEPCPYRLIGYHAQQCAEKHLKAYLVHHGVDFPYTHNIAVLLELCREHAAWPAELDDIEQLTHYAISTRYPGEDRSVDRAAALAALDLARRCRQAVRAQLEVEGVPLS